MWLRLAAGVLPKSCIDALTRFRFENGVGKRFCKFLHQELHFYDGVTQRFCDDFRNGLVHEARLKNGGQFSLETKTTVSELNGLLLINPDCLAQKVQAGLHSYVTVLIQDDSARKKTGTDLETRPFG